MQRLPPRRSEARLRLLLTDMTKYVNLMDEADVDMLLSSLAKTGGLTSEEVTELIAERNE